MCSRIPTSTTFRNIAPYKCKIAKKVDKVHRFSKRSLWIASAYTHVETHYIDNFEDRYYYRPILEQRHLMKT